MVKRLPAMWETRVRFLDWEDPLEEEMATHSSILAWRIPWTEQPHGLRSIGLQRVRHDWRDLAHTTSMLNIIYWIPTNCQAFGGGLVANSCPTLATPWTVACQAPLSIAFSRQEHWSGLPFPSPGDLPNPGIKPGSPALQAGSLLTELWGKPKVFGNHWEIRDD